MLVDSPASFAFDELVNEHKFHLVTANDRQVALTFTTNCNIRRLFHRLVSRVATSDSGFH